MKASKLATWNTLSSRELLKTRIFTLNIDESVCPRNGSRNSFYVFGFGEWVNVIALTDDREIVLIRQFRHGTKQIELEIPGGLVDKSDKDPLSAGVRELLEETGYQGKTAEIIGKVSPNPALQGNLCWTVLVTGAEKSADTAMEQGEDIETLCVPEDEIEDLILRGEIRHGLVLNAFQMYFMAKKRRGER